MDNPAFVDLPVDVFTKVLTSITSATITRERSTPGYFYTYRIAGDPKPADDKANGIRVFRESEILSLGYGANADVYMIATGKKPGRVFVEA